MSAPQVDCRRVQVSVRTGLYTLVGALSESKPSGPPLFGARPIDCISACRCSIVSSDTTHYMHAPQLTLRPSGDMVDTARYASLDVLFIIRNKNLAGW